MMALRIVSKENSYRTMYTAVYTSYAVISNLKGSILLKKSQIPLIKSQKNHVKIQQIYLRGYLSNEIS